MSDTQEKEKHPWIKSVVGIVVIGGILGGIGYGLSKLVTRFENMTETERNCGNLTFCDTG